MPSLNLYLSIRVPSLLARTEQERAEENGVDPCKDGTDDCTPEAGRVLEGSAR